MNKLILVLNAPDEQFFLEEIILDKDRSPKVDQLLNQLKLSFANTDKNIDSPNETMAFSVNAYKNTTASSLLRAMKSLYIVLTAIVSVRDVKFNMVTKEDKVIISSSTRYGTPAYPRVELTESGLPLNFLSNKGHLMLPVGNEKFKQFFIGGRCPIEVTCINEIFSYSTTPRTDLEQSCLSIDDDNITLSYNTDAGYTSIDYRRDVLIPLMDLDNNLFALDENAAVHANALKTIHSTL